MKIPSVFINHNDGQLLKELLEDAEGASVMVKITFQNQKTEKVDLTFWLQASKWWGMQTTGSRTGSWRTSASTTR